MIDISVPRECISKEFEREPGPCPRCGSPLQQQSRTYLVATRRGGTVADSFIIGSDFGWFCPGCPTVVISSDEVARLLSFNKPGWDVGAEFAVLGIVDLDAIPPEKAHLPLGHDDNPIPLVQFTNISAGGAPERPKSKRGSGKKRPKRARLRAKEHKKKKKRRRG